MAVRMAFLRSDFEENCGTLEAEAGIEAELSDEVLMAEGS
jgi:hypothetical protein